MSQGSGTGDVFIQDSTAPLFQYFLMDEQKTDITLTSDVTEEDEVVNVSAGHGFTGVAGEVILLLGDNRALQTKIKNVVANAITIDAPCPCDFLASVTNVIRGNILLNVDGSTTPVEFSTNLTGFTIPIDISKAIFTMQHGTNVPDDGKFGGIAALANGVYFRKLDGATFSLGNYSTNQDFRDMGAEVNYTAKAPAGENATNITFDIQKVFGQVVRLSPVNSDRIIGVVRDDISLAGTGMKKFTISLVGSYTIGEQ